MKYTANIGIVLVFIVSIFTTLNSHANWYSYSFNSMGTRAHVEFYLPEVTNPQETRQQLTSQQLIAVVVDEMNRLDNAYSPYKPSSELSKLNEQANDTPVKISAELYSLIEKSQDISKQSDGAFDITYASVGYQYDYRNRLRPTKTDIENKLAAINYRSVILEPNDTTVSFKHKQTKIDLGGIAKGYAIARCIDLLKENAIKHALMSAGGDTALLGDRNGRPWIVGIKHPRSENKNAVHIPLADEVISTSGDYERYFVEQGVRYHHIINPKTGDSAREVVSVSVIGKDATTVDALSTTVFVQGLVDGMAMINNMPDYEAIIIDNEQRLHFSLGLQQ